MEKSKKQLFRILKILPRMASAKPLMNFQVSPPRTPPLSPPHSPRKAPSAVALVPKEARIKTKKENSDTQEPTSPKVSCLGDIKGFKRKKKKKMVHKSASSTSLASEGGKKEGKKKKKKSLFSSFSGKSRSEIKVVEDDVDNLSTNSGSFREVKGFGNDHDEGDRSMKSFGEIIQFSSGRRVGRGLMSYEEMVSTS